MKVATAFYDKNGLLVFPRRVWEEHHPTIDKLTTEAGYWHVYHKYFPSPELRDAVALKHGETIERRNGSPTYIQAPMTPVDLGDGVPMYRLYMQYIIEEPNRGRYIDFAATADRIGLDPDFVAPFDGVAEYGPDYRTPHPEPADYAVGEPLWDPPALTPREYYGGLPEDDVAQSADQGDYAYS